MTNFRKEKKKKRKKKESNIKKKKRAEIKQLAVEKAVFYFNLF
tara:strand:- start:461 stop:589 length:129 start_codon:yes stop_codon:yes gene_type:complete